MTSALSSGSVFTWGRAKNYRLGRPFSGRDVRVPEEVSTLRHYSVKSAACGGGHTAVILEDHSLHVFGYSQYGQLGLGDRTDMCDPCRVLLIPEGSRTDDVNASQAVAEVCCGRYHTIARSEEGQVWTWGGGKNGRLGHGDEKIRPHPTQVASLKGRKCVRIAAGYHSNLALMDDGKLYSWGWGAHGQLGLGDTNDHEVPTLIASLSGIRLTALACGDRHAFAVADSGQVYTWGSNQFGQLGFGRKGDTVASPTLIPGLDGLIVVAVSCGDRHSAAVTNTGALYTWGCGTDGQCGHGDLKDLLRPKLVESLISHRIVNVCCGHNFTLALTDKKQIFAFGNNTYGQLGNNGSGKQETPVQVLLPATTPIKNIVCAHFHCILWTDSKSTEGDFAAQPLVIANNDGSGRLCDGVNREMNEGQERNSAEPHGQDPGVRKEELADALSTLTMTIDSYSSKREASSENEAQCLSSFEDAVRNLKTLDVAANT